jgi:hypothetical protein
MATFEKRITFLEKAENKKVFRPMSISYFYGESLPADFYTNPIYLKSKVPSIDEFYTGYKMD